jgi:hypothetical protein
MGGSCNGVIANLFFSKELHKKYCNVSKLKKAAFMPPFLIVAHLL